MSCSVGQAAPITLTASDTLANGITSFTQGTNWSGGLVPTAGNTYTATSPSSSTLYSVRTPVTATSYVFGGDSLGFTSASLVYKGSAASTLTANYIFNSASVNNATNINTTQLTMAGTITVGSAGSFGFLNGGVSVPNAGVSEIWANNGPILVSANISGSSGSLALRSNGSGNNNGFVTLTGTSTFTGNIISGGIAALHTVASSTSVLTFAIGASGVNNNVSGTYIDFNGTFKFDLASASTTPGSTWFINQTTNSTYSATTFKVTSTAGDWANVGGTWTSPTGDYFYSQTTGYLTAVPEPSSVALAISAALGAIVISRLRKRSC